MGIEIHEWPPGAFEQATLIARGLLAASGGEVSEAREPLLALVATMVLRGCRCWMWQAYWPDS